MVNTVSGLSASEYVAARACLMRLNVLKAFNVAHEMNH